MMKNNFNSIDKIKTPDEWKAKALKIPCTHIKTCDTKRTVFYRLATSLCLTIVCLFSLILFVHMDKILQPHSIISNKPYNTTATYSETKNTQTSLNNNKGQNEETDNQDNTTSPQINLEPSEKNVATVPEADQTEKPTNPNTSTPTINPTSSPTIPTETEQPTQKPTEKPKNVIFNGSLRVEGIFVTNIDVYCKIFDSNGNLLGSNDLFDWQHEAEFVGEVNNVEYYRYCASEKGLTFTEGYYTYVFYEMNGSEICSGTQYVS